MKIHIFLSSIILFILLVAQLTTAGSWSIETIDKNGGNASQICIDENEHPHIAYFDKSELLIRYIYFNENSTEKSILPQHGGPSLSLVLDTDGNPHIAYSGPDGLHYAVWNNTYEYWSTYHTDQDSTVLSVSLALDSSGNPHICYSEISPYLEHNNLLKYTVFDGNNWSVETLAQEKIIGDHLSLSLDSSGNPHICYSVYDGKENLLKYMWFDGNWETEIIDSHGIRPSLVIDNEERPHISYANASTKNLEYAWFDGSKWHIQTVDSNGDVGVYSSIALDSKGNPHIAYFDSTNKDLKYAWFDGNKWNIETVDSDGNVGVWPSLAIDKNDISHITYADDTHNALKDATGVGSIQNSSKGAAEFNQSLIILVSLVGVTIIAIAISVWYWKKVGKHKSPYSEEVKPKNENK